MIVGYIVLFVAGLSSFLFIEKMSDAFDILDRDFEEWRGG